MKIAADAAVRINRLDLQILKLKQQEAKATARKLFHSKTQLEKCLDRRDVTSFLHCPHDKTHFRSRMAFTTGTRGILLDGNQLVCGPACGHLGCHDRDRIIRLCRCFSDDLAFVVCSEVGSCDGHPQSSTQAACLLGGNPAPDCVHSVAPGMDSQALHTDSRGRKKLEPLKELPGLQKRLDSLPELQEKIRLLQAANVAANDSLAKKQDLIEGLTQTVVSQQQIAAERAHKELKATENVLNTNINQYRTDTTTAVGRILRPPRTLGDRRAALVSLLRLSGPHDIAITPARGSQEAIAFASELEAAFKDAGWKIVRTQKLVFLIKDGIGLELQVQPMPTLKDGDIIPFDLLTPGQAAVAKAFSGAGIQLISNGVENGMTGPTELYVGLQ